jgi:asparaginyl-tRNA synthetase
MNDMTFSFQKDREYEKSWMDLEQHYLKAIADPWYKVLIEVQDALNYSTTEFFRSENLKTLLLPITTGCISSPMGLGSDSHPVPVNIAGIETYLADSMQFMLEYGCRFAQPGCSYFMPSFRGEKEDQTHLSQFYHSEAEIQGSLSDVIQLVERYIKFMCTQILEHHASSIESVTKNLSHIEKVATFSNCFPQITFDEAVNLLDNNSQFIKVKEPGIRVLTRQGEQALIAKFDGFVWVTEFDHLSVPFYQAFTAGEKKSKSADLLFGLGEVVGAGERHTTGAEMLRALELHKVDPSTYKWYYQMKENFPLQTAGFGLGTERFICWLLKNNDVRDCQLIPRFNGIKTII